MKDLEDILKKAEENYILSDGKSTGAKAQMLSDLGYLSTEVLSSFSMVNIIEEAYQSFLADFLQSGLISNKELGDTVTIYQDQFGLKLLQAVTDIDEGLQIGRLPELGEYGLITRIIHYRLSLLGLYTGPVDLCFNAYSYAGIEKAAAYINKTKLITVNLLADMQGFTEAFLQEKGFTNSIVVFRSGIAGKSDKLPEYSGKFKRQLRRDLGDHKSEFEILDKHLFFFNDDKVDENFLKSMAAEDINLFILRLIQIHQWMAGYYNGALDSEYSLKTIASLTEIIENYNEDSGNNIGKEDVLARVTDDYCILNCLYFLKHYQDENLMKDRTLSTLDILSESYNKAEPNEQQAFETNFQKGVDFVKSSQGSIPEKRNGVIRRVFFGIRAFFKKAFRFARKLFRWIVKGMGSFVQNVIRMIYSYLKDAIRHFIDGVKFLLGRLPVTTQNKDSQTLFTLIDLDKDVYNIFGTANTTDVNNHVDMVMQKVYSMSFSLAVIGFLYQGLKFAMSTATLIGWPLFILKLVTAFRNVIDSYKLVLTT